MNTKRIWSDEDIDRLKALVASGATAARASVALKRGMAVTKNKARDIGCPFQSEIDRKRQRRLMFSNTADRPRVSARFPLNDQ